MAEITLPPTPPRPAPVVRPTMTRTPETPGNKGVKVIMIEGPGAEQGPQPEPSEPLAVADGKGANWVGSNVYEIGRTIEGRTAEYEGGVGPVTYRYRLQTKATGSETWVNQAWTNTTNAKNPVYFEITEAGQLRLQSQARDSSDPVAQVNSVTGTKTIQPQTTIGSVFIAVDGAQAIYGDPIHVKANTPVEVVATINGDAQPTYKWEARGGYPMGISQQAATTVLTFPQEGGPTVILTVQSSNASDSPITYGMNFYVASQAEWDALHPAS